MLIITVLDMPEVEIYPKHTLFLAISLEGVTHAERGFRGKTLILCAAW